MSDNGRMITPEDIARAQQMAAGMQPAGPQVVPVAINDIQMTMLVAAHLGSGYDAPEAVQRAIDIVAEAVVQVNNGGLMRAVQTAKKRLEDIARAQIRVVSP